MSYVVVGAGAIGGTVGARLLRAGHDVLLCDADAGARRGDQRVRARRWRGRSSSSRCRPARSCRTICRTAWARCCWRSSTSTRATALARITPRLAADGYVVSLQNGLNEPLIAEAVGEARTVGAFVNFGADYLGPGRIHYAGRGTFVVGELDGRALASASPRWPATSAPRRPATCSATCGPRRPTGRCCSPPPSRTCRSPTRWPSRATGALFLGLAARGARRDAEAPPEPFDGFDAARPRGLARAARGVQPPLGQDALGHLPRPGGAQAAGGAAAGRPRRAAGRPDDAS